MEDGRKILYILAPNDRFNYGDLLFPYIIKHYLAGCVDEFTCCSTTDSDLSARGGDKTRGLRILNRLNARNKNILVVAGGESLLVNWECILSYVFPLIDSVIRSSYKPIRKFFGNITYFLLPYWLKLKGIMTSFPYTIGRNELRHLHMVLYNSVGGTELRSLPKALTKESLFLLTDSDYLAVRDNLTNEILSEYGVSSSLVADSAILMSEIFDNVYLDIRTTLTKDLFQDSPYVFFQINNGIASRDYIKVVKQLQEIREITKCKICLCPIGTALGHEDDVALEVIYKQIDDKDVVLVKSPTIWDIMSLIKNARLYVGTSLHGVITAMSFGIPFVGVEVKKIRTYLETWTPETSKLLFCKIDQISKRTITALEIGPVNAEKQKESVKNSFEKMRKMISML